MGWSYTLAEVHSWYATKLAEWDWGRVAEGDGEPVVFIAMTGALIDQLFVPPDAQRDGIGSTLLELALERGLRPVTLTVFEQNGPARELYDRRGFKVTERFYDWQDKAVALLYRLD